MKRMRHVDLALEAQELWRRSAGETTQLPGVRARTEEQDGLQVEIVQVLDEEGERALGKERGTYVTLTLDALMRRERDAFSRAVEAVAKQMKKLLGNLEQEACVLVVGLGNRAITPDALGPRVHDHILITRHLVEQAPESFAGFRPVAGLAAGVLGTTGMESGEWISAVCAATHPARIIAVDALVSRSVRRLCRTVQLADTGIAPGSGVGNHRKALDRQSLGVPVLSVGVPTVVDAAALAAELTGAEEPEESDLLVTPRDIDRQVKELARVVGYGINLALNPELTLEDLELLLA